MQAIRSAMAAAGLNGTRPAGCLFGYCWEPQFHPMIFQGSQTGTIAVSYLARPGWRLRFQATAADLDAVSGYRDPGGWLFLHQHVNSYSALMVAGVGGLRLGAGPAFHRTAVIRSDGGMDRSVVRFKIGMTLLAAITLPAYKRFFAELSAQSQIVGSGPIGPYTAADSTTTMARTRGSFSYRTVKLGIGARL